MAQPCGIRPRRRAAFPLCFTAGLLLMLAAVLGSVVWNASRTALFADGLSRYVAAAGVMSQGDAETFAAETIGYLTGALDAWTPAVTVYGGALIVPEAFAAHMAAVRSWMLFLKTALPPGAALGLLLLALCAWGGSRGGRGDAFSQGGYYAGAALPLAVTLGACLWAALDFNGFWSWLHTAFIPGGIFPAGERIMALFPQALFAGYIAPVGVTLAVCAAVVFLLPAGVRLLNRKTKKKAAA